MPQKKRKEEKKEKAQRHRRRRTHHFLFYSHPPPHHILPTHQTQRLHLYLHVHPRLSHPTPPPITQQKHPPTDHSQYTSRHMPPSLAFTFPEEPLRKSVAFTLVPPSTVIILILPACRRCHRSHHSHYHPYRPLFHRNTPYIPIRPKKTPTHRPPLPLTAPISPNGLN